MGNLTRYQMDYHYQYIDRGIGDKIDEEIRKLLNSSTLGEDSKDIRKDLTKDFTERVLDFYHQAIIDAYDLQHSVKVPSSGEVIQDISRKLAIARTNVLDHRWDRFRMMDFVLSSVQSNYRPMQIPWEGRGIVAPVAPNVTESSSYASGEHQDNIPCIRDFTANGLSNHSRPVPTLLCVPSITARDFSDDPQLSLGSTETSYGSDAESTSNVPYLRNRDSQQDLTDYEAYLATLPPPDGIAAGESLGNS